MFIISGLNYLVSLVGVTEVDLHYLDVDYSEEELEKLEVGN